MDNVFFKNSDKILEIALKNGVNLKIASNIFLSENKISSNREDLIDFLLFFCFC